MELTFKIHNLVQILDQNMLELWYQDKKKENVGDKTFDLRAPNHQHAFKQISFHIIFKF
jgi:hypothetical protein